MDYFMIPAKMAEQLKLTRMRSGNKEKGYIVNVSDLAPIGIDVAKTQGAKVINAYDAAKFIRTINNK